MKTKKNNLTRLVLLLFLLQSITGVQAQIRVGGATEPNRNAILDLNVGDSVDNSTKGLLLPRVALLSASAPSPLTEHTKGMFVYNTVARNDVFVGAYYNNGTRWVFTGGEGEINILPARTKRFEIIIDEGISTQSMIFSGETDAVMEDPHVLNIKPIFDDEDMAETHFIVTSSVRTDQEGTKIMWRVRIANANIDPNRLNRLEKVVISYQCDHEGEDHEPPLRSSKNVQLFVGQ